MRRERCGRTGKVLLIVSLMASACGGGESNSPSSPSSTTTGPAITAVTPNTGPTAGGTPITITGTGFVGGVPTVTIGGVAASNVQWPSSTMITATTGTGGRGAADVVVTVGGRSGRLNGGFTYQDVPVTVAVQAYLSPGGFRRTFTKTGLAGQAMQVCLNELGLTGIDTQRIAVRQTGVDGHVGDYIASAKSGGCVSITPTGDGAVVAFAFATDIYDTMDACLDGSCNLQTNPKQTTVYIDPSFPSTTAEKQAVDNMIAAYNAALTQVGVSVGSLTRVDGTGKVRIKFDSAYTVGGANNLQDYIAINTPLCISKGRDIQGVLIEEMFYVLNHVHSMSYPFGMRGSDDRSLTQRGANLTNYTYLMSPKNWSGTTALPPLASLQFGPVEPSGAAMDSKRW